MGAPLATTAEREDTEEQERDEAFTQDPIVIGILHEECMGTRTSGVSPFLLERDVESLRSPESSVLRFDTHEEEGDLPDHETQVKASDEYVACISLS